MSKIPASVRAEFVERFGQKPSLLVRSPGRVNLLGEHTDCNDGFVLPAAINLAVYLALRERQDHTVVLYAMDFSQQVEIDLTDPGPARNHWSDYFAGILAELRKLGHTFNGVDCVFSGDLPAGIGLAASAALEGAFSYGLNALYRLGMTPIDLAKLGNRAEHNHVGVKCCVMDQYANIFGRKGAVIRLDCRSSLLEYYPIDSERYRIVICDTGTAPEQAETAYNKRRMQCEASVQLLRKFDPHIRALRDLSMHFLDAHHDALSDELYRISRFVIRENFRVLNGCRDLEHQNMRAFGEKMFASHEGLRDDYGISTPGLDLLVESSRGFAGVVGARMMGGGSGGCMIALVEQARAADFQTYIKQAYRAGTGKSIGIYQAQIDGGVGTVDR